MQYRALGSTGLRVSLIGLGTVKLGRNSAVRYPHSFAIPDDNQARRLLDTARDLGINLLDTAPAYGTSESRLGEMLAPHRGEWILSTKVGEQFEGGASRYDFTPEQARASVHDSLQRLRTDYLDVVLIHANDDDLAIVRERGTLEALQDLRAQGLVRAVGISHKTAAAGRLALAKGADVLMTALSPSDTELAPVVAEAGAAGCGVMIKKALASGTGDPADLRWVAAQPGVSCIVVGTINPDHLTQNVEAASGD